MAGRCCSHAEAPAGTVGLDLAAAARRPSPRSPLSVADGAWRAGDRAESKHDWRSRVAGTSLFRPRGPLGVQPRALIARGQCKQRAPVAPSRPASALLFCASWLAVGHPGRGLPGYPFILLRRAAAPPATSREPFLYPPVLLAPYLTFLSSLALHFRLLFASLLLVTPLSLEKVLRDRVAHCPHPSEFTYIPFLLLVPRFETCRLRLRGSSICTRFPLPCWTVSASPWPRREAAASSSTFSSPAGKQFPKRASRCSEWSHFITPSPARSDFPTALGTRFTKSPVVVTQLTGRCPLTFLLLTAALSSPPFLLPRSPRLSLTPYHCYSVSSLAHSFDQGVPPPISSGQPQRYTLAVHTIREFLGPKTLHASSLPVSPLRPN